LWFIFLGNIETAGRILASERHAFFMKLMESCYCLCAVYSVSVTVTVIFLKKKKKKKKKMKEYKAL